MSQKADIGRQRGKPRDHFQRRAQNKQDRNPQKNTENRIHKVKTARVDNPKPRHAVMDRVKAPQRIPYVRQAMRPVQTEFRRHQPQRHLQEKRPFPRPNAVTGLIQPCYHRGKANHPAKNNESLHHAFAKQRMRNIGECLAIRLQPRALMRHETLQNQQGECQRQINKIKGYNGLSRRKAVNRQPHAQPHQGRPYKIRKNLTHGFHGFYPYDEDAKSARKQSTAF